MTQVPPGSLGAPYLGQALKFLKDPFAFTVERTRQRFVEESLGALTERPRTGAPPRLTGKDAAHLIAVTCSPAPAGRERWTLQLLADEAVALGLADSLCRETVRQLLKKTNSSRG